MSNSYRATLMIVGLLLAISIAGWRLLQIESAGARAGAAPAPSMESVQRDSVPEVKPQVKPAPLRDKVADLIAAAQRGDVNTVLALVGKGVNINAIGPDGLTPLLAAVSRGSVTPAQIEKLLHAGADASARDSKGRDALTLAVEKDDLSTIVALLKGSGKLADRAAGALKSAASQNHFEALKAMLDHGVDVNQAGKDGSTALDTAIQRGATDTVRFLLERGADPNHKDAEGVTALMHAVERGDRDMIQAVAEKAGANINERNSKGETALMLAVLARSADLAKPLVDAGSDVNAADFEAITPLMSAAAAGNSDLVQLLLDKGADVHVKDAQGETALSLARKNEHTETADLLIKAGAPDENN